METKDLSSTGIIHWKTTSVKQVRKRTALHGVINAQKNSIPVARPSSTSQSLSSPLLQVSSVSDPRKSFRGGLTHLWYWVFPRSSSRSSIQPAPTSDGLNDRKDTESPLFNIRDCTAFSRLNLDYPERKDKPQQLS